MRYGSISAECSIKNLYSLRSNTLMSQPFKLVHYRRDRHPILPSCVKKFEQVLLSDNSQSRMRLYCQHLLFNTEKL